MPDTSTRNSLALPLSTDTGIAFYQGLHTNFETVDAAIAKCNFAGGAVNPGVTSDSAAGYAIGSKWHTNTAIWECTDPSAGAAVWKQIWPGTITGNLDVGAYDVRGLTLTSDCTTGTVPVNVTSTTVCPNLNASLLEGKAAAAFVLATLAGNWDAGSYQIKALQFESDIDTGTGAPIVVASTAKVTNLNADQLDGLHDTSFVKHSLSTAENDFLVGGTGATANTFVKKTLAETKVILAHTHAAELKKATILIGDGVAAITTGIKGGFECPLTGHITEARIASLDATSGAIAIAVWIEPYSGGVPVNDDEVDIFQIAASGTQSEETGLTIDVTVGDWISFNVDSVTSMKLIALSLTIEAA